MKKRDLIFAVLGVILVIVGIFVFSGKGIEENDKDLFKCKDGRLVGNESECVGYKTFEDCFDFTEVSSKDSCLVAFTTNNTDSDLCDSIETRGYKELCYERLARNTENPDWCDMIGREQAAENCKYEIKY